MLRGVPDNKHTRRLLAAIAKRPYVKQVRPGVYQTNHSEVVDIIQSEMPVMQEHKNVFLRKWKERTDSAINQFMDKKCNQF